MNRTEKIRSIQTQLAKLSAELGELLDEEAKELGQIGSLTRAIDEHFPALNGVTEELTDTLKGKEFRSTTVVNDRTSAERLAFL